VRIVLLMCGAVFGWAATAAGQSGPSPEPPAAADAADKGSRLGESSTHRMRFGVIVTADSGPCKGIFATAPIPVGWPEQQVKIVDEEFSPFVKRVSYRVLSGTVRQMLVTIPFLPARESAEAVVTVEMTRSTLLPPEDTSIYVIPESKKLDPQTRLYLGASKGIDSRSKKIRDLAREITKDKSGAWERAEALYDWVGENIEYRKAHPFKGSLQALADKHGDCEELSALFIALCRASDIPARTVWVPDHCYAEFYLHDDEGKGHWFPCQNAGTRSFGGIPETRPILQKGDNFKDPDRPREPLRYVSEFLTGAGGTPRVEFLRETVAKP
jgi:hypothetical protein